MRKNNSIPFIILPDITFMAKITFIVCLILFSNSNAIAQGFSVKGVLRNQAGQPIEFSNIVLYSKPDTVYVAGTVSNNQGFFSFSNLDSKHYLLSISCLGYQEEKIGFTIEKNDCNLENITLQDGSYTLNEVVISGEKSTFRYESNKLIMSIQNTPLSNLGDASDILKFVPGVISKDNTFTVFGKGSPVIYINNKKVNNSSELNLLNSNDIIQVELINNPGAKYDAENRAVIIIKTKKKTGEGFSVVARETIRQGERFSHFENLSSNYCKGGVNVFMNLFAARQKMKTRDDLTKEIFADTIWNEHLDASFKKQFSNYNVQTGIDYDLSAHHSVGIKYQYSNTPSKVLSSTPTTILADNEPYSSVYTTNTTNGNGYQSSVNVFYIGRIADKLDFQADLDYLNNSNTTSQDIVETENNKSRNVTTKGHSTFNIYAGKFNFDYSMSKKQKFSFGGEFSHVAGSGYSNNAEQIIEDDDYDNKERKQALFLLYNLSKKYDLEVGLRYEHVNSSFNDSSESDLSLERKYDNFLPSFSFSIPIKNVQMNLNFSSRLKRPSYRQLNSALYYNSRFHYEQGNPSLQPQKIYNFVYGLNYKFLNIQLDYQYTKDYIGLSTWSDDENSYRTITTFTNYPKYQRLMLQVTGEQKTKYWNTQLSMALSQPRFSTTYRNERITQNTPSAYVTWNNTFKLPHNFTVFSILQYTTKGTQGISTIGETCGIDIGASKSMLNNSLVISLWGSDIFNGTNYTVERKISNIYSYKKAYEDQRFIQLSLTWRLNNVKRKYRGSNSASQETERL